MSDYARRHCSHASMAPHIFITGHMTRSGRNSGRLDESFPGP